MIALVFLVSWPEFSLVFVPLFLGGFLLEVICCTKGG
jgi:hypothetical protein